MRISFCLLAVFCCLLSACHSDEKKDNKEKPEYYQPQKHKDTQQVNLIYPGENHFAHLRQLTIGGDNAEAYFSSNSKKIVFQSNNPEWGGLQCDQIFFFDLSQGDMKGQRPPLISTGDGRTTCAYFLPGDTEILYASTHLGGKECPPKPAHRSDHKYVWPVYDSYDIFVADLKGHIKHRLTSEKGYDAEATVSPKGDKIVYTSLHSGDLELWTMNLDGSHKKQITHELGYDGGAFFSSDGKRIVFRASRPKTPEDIKEYKDFLKQGLVSPLKMEIFTCNVDGSDLKQVTHLGNANWAPFFDPSGQRIIFSSNHEKGGYHFNLYTTDLEGKAMERITCDSTFDAFPMFSPDGKKLIFSSYRNNRGKRGINLFLADWKE